MSKYILEESCQIPSSLKFGEKNILSELYEKYFGYKEYGTLVEVGAYDGISFSNTSCFAKLGWKTLYIEGSPEMAEKCRENYKNYKNVFIEQCCIGDYEGECKLYKGGSVSTIVWDKNASDYWRLKQDDYFNVPIYLFNSVLEKYNWENLYDLLVVDVEEAELKVLLPYDIQRWKPKMAIIETHEFDMGEGCNLRKWKAEPITDFFYKNGYKKIYADEVNTIFILL